MYTVTIACLDNTVMMTSESEHAALERFADLLLWVVASRIENYSLCLLKDGRTVTEVTG